MSIQFLAIKHNTVVNILMPDIRNPIWGAYACISVGNIAGWGELLGGRGCILQVVVPVYALTSNVRAFHLLCALANSRCLSVFLISAILMVSMLVHSSGQCHFLLNILQWLLI